MEREFGKEFRLPGERTCTISLVRDWTEVGFEVSVARRFAWMLNVRIAFWSLCVMVFKETRLEWDDYRSTLSKWGSGWGSDPQPARFDHAD